MAFNFPSIPDYGFSWRTIQVEPIPHSGERITIGAIIQGDDNALMASRFLTKSKLTSIFGGEFGTRLSDAVNISIESVENFYSKNMIVRSWTPLIDGFYITEPKASTAENIEEAMLVAAKASSSLALFIESTNKRNEPKSFDLQTWRKEIYDLVKVQKEGFTSYLSQPVSLGGSSYPPTFDFISSKYAAQFETIPANKSSIRDKLVRAQSKLWQLDQLRSLKSMFHQERYELVLYKPKVIDEDGYIDEFLEELIYEASRKDLNIFSTSLSSEAAQHVIDCAA